MRASVPPRGRRQFLQGTLALIGLGVLASCAPAPPIPAAKRTPSVALLYPGASDPESTPNPLGYHGLAFEEGLGELGYVVGRDLVVEYQFADDREERLRELAAELAGRGVDVIAAVGNQAIQACKSASATIPIVMIAVSNPVESGLVESIARPGGNLTGLSRTPSPTGEKLLELLREAVPGTSRVALLYDGLSRGAVGLMQPAVAALGLELQLLQVELPDQLTPAFRAMQEKRAQALFMPTSPFLYRNGPTIAKLALDHQLPSLFIDRHFVASGGLMSYGTSLTPMYRRAGAFVGKILQGTRPAELPVEQPARFDFVINLKTAQALGLTTPQSVLVQATEIIQ